MTTYSDSIKIIGARQHNLKNLTLEVQTRQITVITGVSGSGKSSLALSTLYAEGQRRYIESFSPYARQFLDREDRPDVDKIDGILPAIAIERINRIRSSRSTVGTITEIEDFLKLLFFRLGRLHCQSCGQPVELSTPDELHQWWQRQEQGNWLVLFPFPAGDAQAVRAGMATNGIVRCLHKGSIARLDEVPLDVIPDFLVLDRLPSDSERERFTDAIAQAYRFGHGKLFLQSPSGSLHPFQKGRICSRCGIEYPEPTTNLFSYNSPVGACPTCEGFGAILRIDYNKVVPDPSLTIKQGAIKPFTVRVARQERQDLYAFCEKERIPLTVPWERLSEEARMKILKGAPDYYGIEGFFKWFETKRYIMHVRIFLARYRSAFTCPDCQGARMKLEALNYRLADHTIKEVRSMQMKQLHSLLTDLKSTVTDKAGELVLNEILTRLTYLLDVGLGYLTLDRSSRSLSGGEIQRVNLTTALGTTLVNTLFVLDEPSVGLHSRDNERLLRILYNLKATGNTLVIVEHDGTVIRAADRVIDMGPGAGESGGTIMFNGAIEQFLHQGQTLTAQYLRGEKNVQIKHGKHVRWGDIQLQDASLHNLKHISPTFPLGLLVCITGVSGSGKSTLMEDILYRVVQSKLSSSNEKIEGIADAIISSALQEVELVDGSVLAATPRATPATLLKLVDPIRKLFVKSPAAQEKNFGSSHFSFNSPDGRCPTCQGQGYEVVEMQFLADVMLRCADCKGRRFRSEILDVKVNGMSIADVMDLSADEARIQFSSLRQLQKPLALLSQLGLGYLRLGQPLATLSAGESQRLKLALHLLNKKGTRTLFLFDEPTTGLHPDDIRKLLSAIDDLLMAGNAVIVIEHNLDFIRASDYVIDLGPEGGDEGGCIVTQGLLNDVMQHPTSLTAKALRNELHREPVIFPTQLALDTANIQIKGAREHNLKNIDLQLPRNTFIAITGLSGSGKSTVAFDILFEEGQRRYIESLSTYARQFIQQLQRPDVDRVTGLPPSIAIEQRITRGGARSTVGTVCEVMHFLRLLSSRIGIQHCHQCGQTIGASNPELIAENLVASFGNELISLVFPRIVGRKGTHGAALQSLISLGCSRIFVDGAFYQSNQVPPLARYAIHDIGGELVQLKPASIIRSDLILKIQEALRHGEGHFWAIRNTNEKQLFSSKSHCLACNLSFEKLEPRTFSFHSPAGQCEHCQGVGTLMKAEPYLSLPVTNLSIEDGGCPPLLLKQFPRVEKTRLVKFIAELDIDKNSPVNTWTEQQRSGFLNGADGKEGLLKTIERLYEQGYRGNPVSGIEEYISPEACPICKGLRLKPAALSVHIADHSVAQLIDMTVDDAVQFWQRLALAGRQRRLAQDVIPEIIARLKFMQDVGLGYLSLARGMNTLSGGEIQRTRLAAQLGSELRGVLYVLDEPTIGLHRRDHIRLLQSLETLRDRGNSVVIVEHDDETIRRSELVVDLGPGGGKLGGNVVAVSPPDQLMQNPQSLTGACLLAPISMTSAPAQLPSQWITAIDATAHNLKHVTIAIPVGKITAITGVSGSGKSSFLLDVLYENLPAVLRHVQKPLRNVAAFSGTEFIDRLVLVDQSPIGRTPRSNPCTYIGCFDSIRALFASLPEARARGYKANYFSFNVKGGRCESCMGQGKNKVEMRFLPDVSVLCDVCNGKRFRPEILEITFRDKSIADVLDLTIEEAAELFSSFERIARPLNILVQSGLGYLTLGQESNTLSGGEAQRVKLASELGKSPGFRTLYLLDEPTTGLHMADVAKLLSVLRTLVDRGDTVVVVEHDLDFIAGCDHIIDLGPEGAEQGGYVVAQGHPETLINGTEHTYTIDFLRQHVQRKGNSLPR